MRSAASSSRSTSRSDRHWLDAWTRDLARDVRPEDLQRLFTRDTRDAYRFFSKGLDEDELANQGWLHRQTIRARQVFVAFTLKLSPARRALYLLSIVTALFGILKLYRGLGFIEVPFGVPFLHVALPALRWADGTLALLVSFLLINLLVLLEVADRLSLKSELEVAREIQLAMLPGGTALVGDVEISGTTRPANTVGGDFYDVLPFGNGRVILALGDVAGKGSPAALLMALLLAVLRTLVDEQLEACTLMERLNRQICRHAPGSRFITLFYGIYTPATGALAYVNAGQTPPLLRRADGRVERLMGTGVALGMFDESTYEQAETSIEPGDLLVLYSDGITEAEDPAGRPFEESGLESVLARRGTLPASELGTAILREVEAHAHDSRFTDDLTVLVLKRR